MNFENLEPDHSLEILFNDIDKELLKNNKIIPNALNDKVQLFQYFFNVQQKLFKNHYFILIDPYYQIKIHQRIILHSYVKNIYLLHTAHNLICDGVYGASNIILRQVYEFLIIAKYASLKKGECQKINKWLENSDFNIYKNVFKILDNPTKDNLFDFWKIMCNYTHATTTSFQIGYDPKLNSKDIQISYHFLLMLLRCNYHILNSHFFDKNIKNRSNQYYKLENQDLRLKAKEHKAQIFSYCKTAGKNLIKDYEKKWILKR